MKDSSKIAYLSITSATLTVLLIYVLFSYFQLEKEYRNLAKIIQIETLLKISPPSKLNKSDKLFLEGYYCILGMNNTLDYIYINEGTTTGFYYEAFDKKRTPLNYQIKNNRLLLSTQENRFEEKIIQHHKNIVVSFSLKNTIFSRNCMMNLR